MVPELEDADNAAMRRLSEGDDLALKEIMDRWQRPMTHYLFRHLGREHDAVSLAQETFVRVYEQRGRYKPTGKFATWLFTIATNLCRNHVRWQVRHPTVPLGVEADGEDSPRQEPVDPGATPSETVLAREKAAAVQTAITLLPEDLRTAVLLFEYENLGHEEIARVQECSAKAVEMRLYRARQLLRDRLRAFFGPDEKSGNKGI
ncbi:RNA polymerase sigma-70 factor, ECF subfamily [Verrucomicrobium sp. GAS474]|uniref:RNA polymerase sigma factor n=1 Tax=Verrucomicrobium sp. GAS474 TaxID=1882831 RepID=UPI00087C47EA|nr:RNA polymerase sigma factor [Verrucomicrobium sp. GAS474]SDT90764.1 RNA polymerase sigma-70 factor, ECF subfamily [Verrucomicrobium sp. GAS474]